MTMVSKRPTIKDVAARAGVSYQPVSRLIKDKGQVLSPPRERVENALRDLKYRPSAIARGMVSGRTNTLACISPNLTDFTFASLIEGAARALQSDYFLMNTSGASDQEVGPHWSCARRADLRGPDSHGSGGNGIFW